LPHTVLMTLSFVIQLLMFCVSNFFCVTVIWIAFIYNPWNIFVKTYRLKSAKPFFGSASHCISLSRLQALCLLSSKSYMQQIQQQHDKFWRHTKQLILLLNIATRNTNRHLKTTHLIQHLSETGIVHSLSMNFDRKFASPICQCQTPVQPTKQRENRHASWFVEMDARSYTFSVASTFVLSKL